MPFKWVQCRVCARTMHINAFPEPNHRALKKAGYGTCKVCDGQSYDHKLMSPAMVTFREFIMTCEGDQ